MKPLVSISIPTYNRADLLKSTLSMLCKQIDEDQLHSQVEIVISDNASSDNTQEVVSEFIKANKFQINYHRNSVNLGVIKNILKLVEYTSAKYWMFYGDDDVVPPGFLKQIIPELESNEHFPAFMFKFPEMSDAYCQNLNQDTVISYEHLARDFFYYIGNAGVFAVETEKAKQIVKTNLDALLDTCWPQTLIVFVATDVSDNRNIRFKNLVSSFPPPDAIIIHNSYYLFETTIYALLRTALYIEKITGKEFMDTAINSVYGIQHYPKIKNMILERYLYFDQLGQKRDLENSITKAMQDIPVKCKTEIKDLYRIISRPQFMIYLGLYYDYFKRIKSKDLNTSFINKLKIISPLGYNAMINNKRAQYSKAENKMKKIEVDSSSGYF